MTAHGSIVAPTNAFWWAPGSAGTVDLATGKEGEVLAPVLSFCLLGHSCLIGGSHCQVWHRCSMCVCVCVFLRVSVCACRIQGLLTSL